MGIRLIPHVTKWLTVAYRSKLAESLDLKHSKRKVSLEMGGEFDKSHTIICLEKFFKIEENSALRLIHLGAFTFSFVEGAEVKYCGMTPEIGVLHNLNEDLWGNSLFEDPSGVLTLSNIHGLAPRDFAEQWGGESVMPVVIVIRGPDPVVVTGAYPS